MGQKPSRRELAQQEAKAVLSDKVREARGKEDATMAMFRQLAADRFGK